MIFRNRQEAGRKLAAHLSQFQGPDTVVLALPRGGVVLGAEIAKTLHVPLDVILVRKIGHPGYREYAIAAVTEGADPLYNEAELITVDEDWLEDAIDRARRVMQHRRELYYGNELMPEQLPHKTVIIVDDGIATGLSMFAAILAVRQLEPKRILAAVPVAPPDSVSELKKIADEVIVLDDTENYLGAVGAHYEEFEQVSDEEVAMLLREVHDGIQQTATGNP